MGPFPNLYILVSILLLAVFYLRQADSRYRQYCIILASALFVISVSLSVFLAALLAIVFIRLVVPRVNLARKGPYLVAVAVSLVPVFINDMASLANASDFLVFYGGGFLGIRTFLLLKSIAEGKATYTSMDVVTYLLFFPVYLAGPIERPDQLNQKIADSRWDISLFVDGFMRFLVGMVKIYLIAVILSSVSQSIDIETSHQLSEFWLFCIVNWFLLYFLFSGYADIAIGTGGMFGIPIRENFNFPFISRSIQEYWQRWNITLMEVVSENVYRPFVRKTGRRAVGFYVSFFAMGMWHSVSFNFLLHGLIHASAFAVYFHYSRSRAGKKFQRTISDGNVLIKNIWMITSVFITLTCVAVASAIGTTNLLQTLVTRLS